MPEEERGTKTTSAPLGAPHGEAGLWQRIKDHKLIQTALAYFAAAIAIAHAEELIAHAYEWPEVVQKVTIGALGIGLPMALAIVWLRGRKRVAKAKPAMRWLDLAVLVLLAVLIAALIGERFLFGESQEPSRYIIVAIGLLVAVLLIDRLFLSRGREVGVREQAVKPGTVALAVPAPKPVAAPASSDDRISIAVLPFLDLSPGKDQEYFSDGLSEELMNQLAHINKLRVAARTSCFAFKGQSVDLKVVGERLGVGHVLEGSVRKAGDKLRITAQLIKASDGYHLWSNTFDRELNDVFAIQEDIARAVADALKITLGVGESTLAPGGTKNVTAYDVYLRAQSLTRQTSASSIQRAIALYREAVTLDPGFAMAWLGLALSYGAAIIYSPESAEDWRRLSEKAFERAIASAPDAPMIHALRGTQLFLGKRDWIGAGQAFEKAIELAPSEMVAGFSDSTTVGFPFFLAAVGRMQESLEHYRIAVRTEPLASMQMLQFTLDCLGRFEESEADYRRTTALPLDPAIHEYFKLLRTMAHEDAAGVKAQFRRYLVLNDQFMPIHGDVLARFDDEPAVLELIRKAFQEPFYQDSSHMNGLASMAAYFGDDVLAIECLRQAFVEHRGIQVSGIWHPLFARLRKSPSFKDLVRGIGLVDYWRKSAKWGDFARPLGADDFEVFR